MAGRAGAAPCDWRTLVERIAWITSWAGTALHSSSVLCLGLGCQAHPPCGADTQFIRSVQESFSHWDPTTGMMGHTGCFVPGLWLKGRTCLAKGFDTNPTCAPLSVTVIGNNFWKIMVFTCTTELEAEDSLWSTKPYWKVLLNKRWAQNLFSFLKVIFFSQFSAGFLQRILVRWLWNSLGNAVPAHTMEAS